MPDNSEGRAMLEALKEELRENRKLMQTVHADLERERKEPPTWVAGVLRRLEALEHDVYGNGRDGLKTAVTRLEEAAKQRIHVKDDGAISMKLLIAIVGGIATVVSALIGGIFLVVAG